MLGYVESPKVQEVLVLSKEFRDLAIKADSQLCHQTVCHQHVCHQGRFLILLLGWLSSGCILSCVTKAGVSFLQQVRSGFVLCLAGRAGGGRVVMARSGGSSKVGGSDKLWRWWQGLEA